MRLALKAKIFGFACGFSCRKGLEYPLIPTIKIVLLRKLQITGRHHSKPAVPEQNRGQRLAQDLYHDSDQTRYPARLATRTLSKLNPRLPNF